VPQLLPGDYNHKRTVAAADYVVWRKIDRSPAGYNTWRTHFSQSSATISAAPGFAGG